MVFTFHTSWLDVTFLLMTLLTVILGVVINLLEARLPGFLRQTFRYGKFAYKGNHKSRLISMLEMPKSNFRHFYLFAAVWSIMGLLLMVNTHLYGRVPHHSVVTILNLICGTGGVVRTPTVRPLQGLVAMSLLSLQCVRRFYETYFVQVFSKAGRMNVSHYMIGFVFYFGAVVAILGETHGFVRGASVDSLKFELKQLDPMRMALVGVFLYAWWGQWRANITLANLRKNNRGAVVSERHQIPFGGWFNLVSSPHMMFEMLMYLALMSFMPENHHYKYILLWVVCNQTECAFLTHKWYQKTFNRYPKNRMAVFPHVF